MRRPPFLAPLALAALALVLGCPKRPPPPVEPPLIGAALLPDLVARGVPGLPNPDASGFIVVGGGEELSLGVWVSNDGADAPIDATDPLVVRLLLSPSRLVEPGARVVAEHVIARPIGPGAEVRLPPGPVRFDAPAGDWWLLLIVDPDHSIEEAYASNNILAAAPIRIKEEDRDQDGMPDRMEVELARTFAPALVLHPKEECGARFPTWSVEPIFGGASIFYALNWERDCGLPLGRGAAAHLGDAEFVVVELLRDAGTGWEVRRVFLSAHYRAGEGKTTVGEAILDYSGWFPPEVISWQGIGANDPSGWHPRVIVARHKHANYANLRACKLTYDSCAEGATELLEVRADGNMGSARTPLLAEVERDGRVEWFWRGPLPFCGWQVASLVLAERRACAGFRNSWYEQLTAWLEGRL